MFRLACFDDVNKNDGDGLYRYLSSAISDTITDCLNEFIEAPERYSIFLDMYFGGEFFSGLSQYIDLIEFVADPDEADHQAGYEFTLAKIKRMKEKMLDQQEFYTFDVYEEKILYSMCKLMADRARTAVGRKKREPLKTKVEEAKQKLKEEYGQPAYKANDYSRKMYYASAMLLKPDEDDNLIFWDDDYDFFWRDGFIEGIHYLKRLEGQSAGYGYQYTCRIFSDIGIKPPLMLLGTEEANKIVTKVQQEQFNKHISEVFGDMLGSKTSNEDSERSDDDLPFG